ncbi:MAG: galactose mutarotase [Lachnospiraceae bacterium]|nr:galactose mutarotase [Lachnospiraceae bacterium]
MEIVKKAFGTTKDDKDISAYTLSNGNGMSVTVSELGAIITEIIVPDRNGAEKDVVLGYDKADPYYENNEFFGATIGRSANRIQGAAFEIDGTKVQLPVNENSNNLHSDMENGFHKKLWTAAPDESRNAVTMSYTSPDGENGFPGNLDMHVTFSLSDDNELSIRYEGVSDKKTLINCTNHTYFNLAGHDAGNIEGHYMKINASNYTPVEPDSIPTGEIAPVEGTPFDFREFHKVGERIGDDNEQLHRTKGYDHNYVIDEPGSVAAVVEERNAGIRMEVITDLPGIQFYAGNCIRDNIKGKNGAVYGKRSGLCLETQYFPNSANQEGFKRPVFGAGERYDTTTVYRFSTF